MRLKLLYVPYPAPRWGGPNLPPPGFPKITPKLLHILTQNLVYLILRQFDIEWPNFVEIGRNIFEKFTFLWGHSTPISTKNGSMLRNSPKIRVLTQTTQKEQYTCKIRRSTKRPSRNWKKIEFLNTKIYFEKPIFLEKPQCNPKFFEIKKKQNNVIEPHVYYVHAKFKGNTSIFGTQSSKNLQKLCIPKFSMKIYLKL